LQGPDAHTFRVVSGQDKGKMQVATYTSLGAKDGSQHWKRTIGDQYDEFLTLGAGATGKTAETAKVLVTHPAAGK
jgi:hypothetical protein